MSWVTGLYAGWFYFAFALLVVGVVVKVVRYARTPAPLKIPTTPAPTTRAGVVWRMIREIVFFESLFKGNKWTWLFGWLFHFALVLVLARHLRYFIEPVWQWVTLIQPFGKYAAFAMVAGLLGLWARRFLVDRVRYISAPSDHLMLALLVGIALSGLGMKYIEHTDIVAVKAFILGLMYFDIQPLPADNWFLLAHLGMVATLMMVFPYSKLMHGVGLLFSPSRNQVDDPRERRHVAPWAEQLSSGAAGK